MGTSYSISIPEGGMDLKPACTSVNHGSRYFTRSQIVNQHGYFTIDKYKYNCCIYIDCHKGSGRHSAECYRYNVTSRELTKQARQQAAAEEAARQQAAEKAARQQAAVEEADRNFKSFVQKGDEHLTEGQQHKAENNFVEALACLEKSESSYDNAYEINPTSKLLVDCYVKLIKALNDLDETEHVKTLKGKLENKSDSQDLLSEIENNIIEQNNEAWESYAINIEPEQQLIGDVLVCNY